MQKVGLLLIALMVIGVPMGYCVHLWVNYEHIQKDSAERSTVSVTPKVDGESVAEFGYIFEMRRENYIRDGYRNLVWFIVIPSTGQRLSCPYDKGFDGFRVGDSVKIIHNTVHENEAETGYIVGLYDGRKDKVAMVGTNDLDVMMLDDDEP